MRARLRPFAALPLFVLTLAFTLRARTNEVRYFANYGNALGFDSTYQSTARFDGTTIFVDVESSTLGPYSGRAAIAQLDLDNVDIGEEVGGTTSVPNFFNVSFNCLNQVACAQSAAGEPSPYIGFRCNTREECSGFLAAVRQAAANQKQSELASRQASQSQASASRPAPQQTAPVRQAAAAPAAPPESTALRDLIAMINWLNAGQGVNNNALDKLLKQIEAGKRPTPPPPPKPFYAAFSQAGGFDANGAWGAATAPDLNTAIARANGNCSKGARTGCDDEGYCLLQSGLWAAWASDLTVAGSSAFSCNLKTEDEARQQAQAWCGDGCKVLWSGVGQ